MGVRHTKHSINSEAQARVRTKRDKLLDEADIVHCNADKWEIMDSAMKEKWRDYKDQLRMIPDHPDFPHNVEWPKIPDTVGSKR